MQKSSNLTLYSRDYQGAACLSPPPLWIVASRSCGFDVLPSIFTQAAVAAAAAAAVHTVLHKLYSHGSSCCLCCTVGFNHLLDYSDWLQTLLDGTLATASLFQYHKKQGNVSFQKSLLKTSKAKQQGIHSCVRVWILQLINKENKTKQNRPQSTVKQAIKTQSCWLILTSFWVFLKKKC